MLAVHIIKVDPPFGASAERTPLLQGTWHFVTTTSVIEMTNLEGLEVGEALNKNEAAPHLSRF